MQSDSAHPSWQYPHGTKSHDAQLPGSAKVGAALGAPEDELLLCAPGRHERGTSPSFIIPLAPAPHPFRSMLSGLSTSLSYLQSDSAHPSWQCPHGTKSHDAQLPGSANVGAALGGSVGAALVDVFLLGASVDPLDELIGAGAGVVLPITFHPN